jgi:hypothetical protein
MSYHLSSIKKLTWNETFHKWPVLHAGATATEEEMSCIYSFISRTHVCSYTLWCVWSHRYYVTSWICSRNSSRMHNNWFLYCHMHKRIKLYYSDCTHVLLCFWFCITPVTKVRGNHTLSPPFEKTQADFDCTLTRKVAAKNLSALLFVCLHEYRPKLPRCARAPRPLCLNSSCTEQIRHSIVTCIARHRR